MQKRIPLGRWRWPAYLFLIFFAAFSAILPVLVLVWTSFFGFSAPGNVPLSQASMAGYASAIQSPVVWRATLNSFIVAGLSAVIVTILGALVAWVVVRSQFPGRKILDALTFTSLGIPSVIAGLSVMLVYLSLPIGIYGTVWILVLAYSYRLAVTTRIARAAIMQVHKELEEASQASGAKWAATQLRIVLPLILPGLLSAFLLLFIIGMREFTIPFVLYSQENVVLSVLIWQLFQGGQPAHSAALGILMIVLVIPVIVIARRLIARSGSGD